LSSLLADAERDAYLRPRGASGASLSNEAVKHLLADVAQLFDNADRGREARERLC
jgi:hypothetical protein